MERIKTDQKAKSRVIVVVVLLVFGLGGALAFIGTHQLLSPLWSMLATVQSNFRTGKLERVWVRTHDEFRLFASSLNRMISQIRRSNKALQSMNSELEVRVNSRTLELQAEIVEHKATEIALIAAEKKAVELGKAKEMFLANMSHELRTPMHGILSYARFGLQRWNTANPEKLKEYFGEIHDCCTKLLELINTILDLSKLESGKMEFAVRPMQLSPLIEGFCNELKGILSDKNLKLIFESTPDLPEVNLDSMRIGQVVRNFLGNAIKFSTSGHTIDVKVENNSSQGTLVVVVSNQGPGIPKDELEAVFEKFYQSSRTRTSAGGTGLGLAISKEIIEQHGGKIWAESEADGLTRFYFSLPTRKVEEKVA